MALSYEVSCEIGDILQKPSYCVADVIAKESLLYEYYLVHNPEDASMLRSALSKLFAWNFDQQFIEENYESDNFWFIRTLNSSKELPDHVRIYLKMKWGF